jgi:hypothetical protein
MYYQWLIVGMMLVVGLEECSRVLWGIVEVFVWWFFWGMGFGLCHFIENRNCDD